MNLIPRNSLFDLDSLFDAWAPLANSGTMSASAFSPRVDITEKKGHYELTAELPGVNKKDFNLGNDVNEADIKAEFTDGVLKLSVPKVEQKTSASHRIDIH